MQETHIDQLTRVFEALTIHDESSFTFCGRRQTVNPAAPVPTPAPAPPADALSAQLLWTLYEHAYARRFTGDLTDAPAVIPSDDITPSLSLANTGQDRWESGWIVVQVLPSGQVAAQRHGRTRLLWPGEFLATGIAGQLAAGTSINLYWKRESTVLQPGFYFAFGEMIPDHQDETRWVRFYWNIRSTGAPRLVEEISKALNRFEIPFRCKLLTNAGHYRRSDAAVLYVARRYYRIASELLAKIQGDISAELNNDTPLFTKHLTRGVGFAEDPNTGESFGMHRCRLLVDAILTAFKNGEHSAEARLNALERRFHQTGLTLDAPYLNTRSSDDYTWPKL